MPMTECTKNQHQILVPENWYQNLAPVFGTSSCKISGTSNKNGRRFRRIAVVCAIEQIVYYIITADEVAEPLCYMFCIIFYGMVNCSYLESELTFIFKSSPRSVEMFWRSFRCCEVCIRWHCTV